MGFFDSLTQGVENVRGKISARKDGRMQATGQRAKQQKRTRDSSLKVMFRIAAEYKAKVEPLDTAAYVSKEYEEEELGVHISYGLPEGAIRAKMEKAFTKSALKSKVTHGATKAAQGVKKTIRGAKKAGKALGEIRKELKAGLGSGKNSLYPPIKFY